MHAKGRVSTARGAKDREGCAARLVLRAPHKTPDRKFISIDTFAEY
jgi:hypothetical protein